MKVSLAAFTEAGGALMRRLAESLRDGGDEILDARLLRGGGPRPSLSDWTREAFTGDAVVFVGACGIAVRAVAPFVRDKLRDPAVVAVDERGRFAVALLSGHLGGANRLAERVAVISGGTAVISTATDLNGRFAVDVWAASQGLLLCERELARAVSAALLDGRKVGFCGELPVKGEPPEGLYTANEGGLGILVGYDTRRAPFARTLHLVPRAVTVGAGCRKGVPAETFTRVVLDALAAHGIPVGAVERLASIDLKAEEPCMRAFCESYRLPFETASARALAAVEGEFHGSAFVRRATGVDNVCERAALLRGGRLLFGKQSRDAVTVAAAARDWRITF